MEIDVRELLPGRLFQALVPYCTNPRLWYNVSRVRVLLNGRALAFQAKDTGSIPVARSDGLIAQRLEQPAHNRSVPGSNPGGPTGSRSIKYLSRPVVRGPFVVFEISGCT